MDLGELQPLQNLNQLTELNLAGCYELTGQSESESCSETTSELTHWWNRGSSSTAESESIAGVEPPGMLASHWSVSFRICLETTRELTDWSIYRFAGAALKSQPITIAEYFGKLGLPNEIRGSVSEIVGALSQFPKLLGDNQGAH